MKITVLSYNEPRIWGTARVLFTPNRLEKLLGYKPKTKEYKWEGDTYTFGGEMKWYDMETGQVYGRFPEIDDFIRKQRYNKPPKELIKEDLLDYDAFRNIDDSLIEFQKLTKNLKDLKETI